MHRSNICSDQRLREHCIYCGLIITKKNYSRDHVPSKVLLDKPYPSNLKTIIICRKCNLNFSSDEEYVAAILGMWISKSASAEKQLIASSSKILSSQRMLQSQLQTKLRCDANVRFFGLEISKKRLENILLKVAKGLAFHECSEPLVGYNALIKFHFIEQFDNESREEFENVGKHAFVPEVGSLLFEQLATDYTTSNQFKILQRDVFRYALIWDCSVKVRMVFRELLFAEVCFCDGV